MAALIASPLLTCSDCKMTFKSPALLQKHKEKFCVGSGIGDPNRLAREAERLRQATYKQPEPVPPSPDPNLTSKAIDQLRQLKDRKSKLRQEREDEERKLLRDIQDKERAIQRERSRMSVRETEAKKATEFKDLTQEYQRMLEREQRIRDEIDNLEQDLGLESRAGVISRNTDSSMSLPIYTDDEQASPRKNEHTEQLRRLAEHHGKQLGEIQNRNRELERQREEIRRRLQDLGNQPIPPQPASDQPSVEDMVKELREQEKRNQDTLEQLKSHLNNLQEEASRKAAEQRPDSGVQTEFVGIPFQNGSLVSEISAMRLAYLQSGGNDPAVLAQMHDMQVEAQQLEDQNKRRDKKKSNKKEPKDMGSQVLAIELENQRLQRELQELHEHQRRKHRRRASDSDDDGEIRQLQKDHMRKMLHLQHEMELLKQEAMLNKMRRELRSPGLRPSPTQPPPQPQPQPPPPQPQPPPPQPQPAPIRRPPPKPETPEIERHRYQREREGNTIEALDPLLPAPYDPGAGFVVFYDYLLGLDPEYKSTRLIVGLYNNANEIGDPTPLPVVYTEGGYNSYYQNYAGMNIAVIGAKQPVPRIQPSMDLSIIVEMQVQSGRDGYDSNRLRSRGWSKIELFDQQNRVLSGRWKIPLRMTPVKPHLTAVELNNVPQLGHAELYFRLVNWRDSDVQSLSKVNPSEARHYKFPPQMSGYPAYNSPRQNYSSIPTQPIAYVPPPPSEAPPSTAGSITDRRSSRPRRSPLSYPPEVEDSISVGFQVDRVKDSLDGEGKVRLTVYNQWTGNIAQSSTAPMTCTTSPVKSNFKHGVHVFGWQEALFHDVYLNADMIVVARFYLRQLIRDDAPDNVSHGGSILDEEKLVAWSSMTLTTGRNSGRLRLKTGNHKLPLYYPPVPEAKDIPLSSRENPREWQKFGRSTVRFNVFEGEPPRSNTPSTIAGDIEDDIPEGAWIAHERSSAPTDVFGSDDGFDLYIDGARFLPDAVTISRVAGRMFDRQFNQVGPDINTSVDLDSNIFEPSYNFRMEFREPALPPSSILLLKVYATDRFRKQLTVVGWATLNVFVETGTQRQPMVDTPGLQVSLNEGAHQVRLYSGGPNALDPLTDNTLRGSKRHVPCASLLLRLVKAPKDQHGRPLEAERVPQVDWPRLGLSVPKPAYSEGVYYSTKCTPTRGESQLFHAMGDRNVVLIRHCLGVISDGQEQRLKTDKATEQWIRTQLTRLLDTQPPELDLTHVSRYQPIHGLKVAIDGALNLPWSKFTHVHYCFNPPGAFYYGNPTAAYDKLTFTESLDLNSNQKAPVWKDGFTWFPRRSLHRYLVLIVHLQEVAVTVARDNYKYGLLEQAWTAMQIFKDGYAITSAFQLPLYLGAPSQTMLTALSRQPCKEVLDDLVKSNSIKLAEGASVFVRVADARRDEEISTPMVDVNTSLLPQDQLDRYTQEVPSKPLRQQVPQGKTPDQFQNSLASKFKNLVYKLYIPD
ncbi:uncharacterized protein [Branchiostoma lanceolatum]|uniref:uncharacterized protein isoform X2 n=1 Tax=Branchiostoma lanceolatum TaxID=7740 RepID=UPI0034564F9F